MLTIWPQRGVSSAIDFRDETLLVYTWYGWLGGAGGGLSLEKATTLMPGRLGRELRRKYRHQLDNLEVLDDLYHRLTPKGWYSQVSEVTAWRMLLNGIDLEKLVQIFQVFYLIFNDGSITAIWRHVEYGCGRGRCNRAGRGRGWS